MLFSLLASASFSKHTIACSLDRNSTTDLVFPNCSTAVITSLCEREPRIPSSVTMVGGEDLPNFVFVEELASLCCRQGFASEDFEVDSFFAVEEEEEEEDFILASSASKAGARVLTTASRSDCLDRDWTADVSSSFLASLSALLDFFCCGDDPFADDRLSWLFLGEDRLSSVLLGEDCFSSLLFADDRLSGLLERER